MMKKNNTIRKLMKGNEALAEGAIIAGCKFYFGYPITPQNEIPEYMSKRMPETGGTFIQSESELAAINMVLGAAAAGGRAMTSSSSPGISLMQEGISYIAGCELPAVLANVVRGGPGLGGIGPAQSDYYQSVKGGGHGDYYTIVLAPSTVQEMMNLTIEAFDIADKYRNPVIILSDGLLGQMSEAIDIPSDYVPKKYEKPWALSNCAGREPNEIKSLYLDPSDLEKLNMRLYHKYKLVHKNERRYENFFTEDAEILLVAYGSASRICKSAVEYFRKHTNLKIGLFRPITLFPYPDEELLKAAERAKKIWVVEMSLGQMVEDVERIIAGKVPVKFFGRTGGVFISPGDIRAAIEKDIKKDN